MASNRTDKRNYTRDQQSFIILRNINYVKLRFFTPLKYTKIHRLLWSFYVSFVFFLSVFLCFEVTKYKNPPQARRKHTKTQATTNFRFWF